MEKIAKPLAILALALTIGPPVWAMLEGISSAPPPASSEAAASAQVSPDAAASSAGLMTDSRVKLLMAVGAVLWFVAAPYWLKEDKPAEQIIEQAGLQGVP